MVVKVDIKKVFDTIRWPFFLKVLQAFGFDSRFCGWVESIFPLAWILVLFHGLLHGYFAYSWGFVRGTLLIPYCLA